ncbi:MAG: polyprenyl synthetase family protein [Bacillota bacterium]|nr:polyprenyl synthetase family protein [Bacillota bacterium]
MWRQIDSEFAELINEFECFLEKQLPQKGGFLSEVSKKVIQSGGKRLRPAFTILFSMMGEKDIFTDKEYKERVFHTAAAIEILHTATLIHDDIIDSADTRRGKPTVSCSYGTSMAVYTGDFLLVQTMLLLSKSGLDIEYLNTAAKGMEAVCLGEVDQYYQKYKITTVYSYLKRIIKKTALLFSVSATLGARLSGLSDETIKNAAHFGLNFGTAFQLRDDMLDLSSNKNDTGKPVLKDLKDGVITLPLILTARDNKKIRSEIEQFFGSRDDAFADSILKDVIEAGGALKMQGILEKYVIRAKKRLNMMPESKARNILADIVNVIY